MSQRDGVVDHLRAPGHLLRRAQQIHTHAWSQLVTDVTGPQYAVLVAVAGWPGHDQKGIGELASLDKSTAAGIIERLSAAGWVERVADATDRRRRLLELSPAARGALPGLTTAAAAVQLQLLEPLPPKQQDRFIDALGRVARLQGSGILDQRADDRTLVMARTPGYLIRRAQQLHATFWREHVSDVTGPQYAVLVATLSAGAATYSEIGERASLDSSSTRDIVGRLIDGGWLESVDNAPDRRSRPVRVTTPARTAVRLLRDPVRQVQADVLAPLGAASADQFLTWMRLVARVDGAAELDLD